MSSEEAVSERATWIDYVRFLSEGLGYLYSYAHVHGIHCSPHDINKGREFRDKLGLSDAYHEDLRSQRQSVREIAPPDAPRFRTVQLWAPKLRPQGVHPFVRREDARQATSSIADALLFDSAPACERWVREHGTDDYATVPLELRIAVDGSGTVAPDMLAALQDLVAFVGVMCGRGADAIIPETIRSPLGVDIKIGEIMRDAHAAIAKRLVGTGGEQ